MLPWLLLTLRPFIWSPGITRIRSNWQSIVFLVSVFVYCASNVASSINELPNYCGATSGLPVQATWICFFSKDADVSCKQSELSSAITVTDYKVVQTLHSSLAYVNITTCSDEPNRIFLQALAEFENVVVSINVDGQDEFACPMKNIISLIFRRISQNAKCLILLNVSQTLMDNIDNWNRFSSLKELVLLNSSFTSLTPAVFSFMNSTNIERLVIRNTALKNFEMTYRNFNHTLAQIDLSDNMLTRFELDANSTFPSAVYVNLSHNRLHLSPKYLKLDHTKTIVDLSNCGLRRVEDLYGQMLVMNLSHNSITELANTTFDNVDSLTILDLSYNALTSLPDVPFGAHLSLHQLILSHNRISSIPNRAFGNSSLLVSLDLSYNELTALSQVALNFSRLPMLEFLKLDHNRLAFIPSIEPYFDCLTVTLNDNLLTRLSVLPTKFNRQITVSARNNSISDFKLINTGMFDLVTDTENMGIWDPSFIPDWATTNTQRVIQVDISQNKIETLDAHLLMANLVIRPNSHYGVVSFYNISDNPIDCSCDLLNPVKYLLEAYNVSSQHNIGFAVKQVRSLLDTHCQLVSDELDRKKFVMSVAMRELVNESYKKKLKCSEDKANCPGECFCTGDNKRGPYYIKADCSECDCLHDMPFSMPINTTTVHLNGNFIKTFACRTYLSNVQELLLNDNLIETISDCVYQRLQNVEYIRLDSNHLSKFPTKLAYLQSLHREESVNLANNSFSCECSDDVRQAFKAFGPKLYLPDEIECYTEDGTMHGYLHYLDFCSSGEQSLSKSPSGVQIVLLVIMSAIIIVVMIIIAIVTYYVCCLKYVASLRRNFAKLIQRFVGSDRNGAATQYDNYSGGSLSCPRNCCRHLRSQFQFSPLVADDLVENEEVVVDEAECSLSVDGLGRQPSNQMNQPLSA